MDGKYTFDRFYNELEQGYQIFYDYVRNRYVLFKTSENCYTQKLLTIREKNPHPVMEMLTKKRIMEMFPFMENIEYKVRDN